jgi:biopolymer transport protein TolR
MNDFFSQRNNRRARYGVMSDINVTPMVDVMLVLLIIFMVTAPLLTSGISIELPKADGNMLSGNEKTLDISVTSDGKVFVADREYPKNQVLAKVKAITSLNTDMQIVISGDKSSSYGNVVEVMGLLRDGGYTKIGLKTDAESIISAKKKAGNKQK